MNLKQFRKDRGLGQKDIAEIFGCKQNHVSAIESGTRALTPLHIRLLIEKYGFDVVAQYANAAELPEKPSVTINAPVISDNTAPVQAGNNNKMELPQTPGTDSASLIALMNNMLAVQQKQMQQYAEILASKDAELAKRDQQIDRMIDILEKK